MIAIHDPIHGAIEVTGREIKLIDSRAVQRLRHIKQLGFSELAFPGATHTRYAHSLGTLQMATRMIDRVLSSLSLSTVDAARIRQTVRLAGLFHDLGHPPMSHVSERVMPLVSTLNLGAWAGDNGQETLENAHQKRDRQATHEDYTVKILMDSSLTPLIEKHMDDQGVKPSHIAGLICGIPPIDDPTAFVLDGIDLLPLLHQIVSSEMDADRMDYLRRDAYYCGVSYGNFDHLWLTNNLVSTHYQGRQALALQHRGVWAFENFLLSRYHMFLAVYYHHTALCFDHLLGRFYNSGEYQLPSDSEAYLATDDVQLWGCLRSSQNEWANRVAERRSYRLLLETHSIKEEDRCAVIEQRLTEANIDHFTVRKQALLSKYFGKREKVFPMLVVEPELGRVQRIEEYTPLYRRFDDEFGVSRIFCQPNQLAAAKKLLS